MFGISHLGMFDFGRPLAGSDEAKEKHGLRGSRNGRAKLSASQILRIKSDPRSAKEIAATYHISEGHLYKIKRGEKWSHLLITHHS